MTLRKLSVFFLAVIFTMICAEDSFAVIGEGYFGKDYLPYSLIPDLPAAANSPAPAPAQRSTKKTEPRRTRKPEPEPEPDLEESYSENNHTLSPKHEKYSENTDRVIRSYGLDDMTTANILDLHQAATRGIGKREKFERYTMILNDYPEDYLATYRASQIAFEMADYGLAMHWLRRCLEICPDYMPARNFRKRIEGKMKGR